MKVSDKSILLALPLVALLIGFYLLGVAPKRDQISELDEEIASLQESVQIAESEIAVAEEARSRFSSNYADVVALGSAVPEDSDQATFIYDLSKLGDRNSVSFRAFEVSATGGEQATAAPPPATEGPPDGSGEEGGSEGEDPSGDESTAVEAPAPPQAAPPMEAIAATLPIGSTIGPAGLPLMPYKLEFGGSFFDLADFLADLDSSVEVGSNKGDASPKARGRLVTVNGFSMNADPEHGFSQVRSNLSVTTYVVPPGQGIAAGANPAGPAPVTAPPGDSGGGTQTAMLTR